MTLSHEHVGWKLKHQTSKSISSAEPNYFVHFAMRYPVVEIFNQFVLWHVIFRRFYKAKLSDKIKLRGHSLTKVAKECPLI